MRARDLSRQSGDDATDPRDGERSVRVLPHLSDYPMRHGDDGERREFEGRRDAGERAHQKLVRRRAVEPVVEIRGEDPVNRLGVARSQGVIQFQNHGSVLGL
ncbi:BnaAnng42010D [Brassica napus]|uniref:BnaAnng42010D protein n=1 Tax=Brassica napus TaxID=3708 RepID=A0A078K4I4_BRANA|nr:BnaAnng42010D [Brassica napus]